MCGIAGVFNRRAGHPAPSMEMLGTMAGALKHRGPDEFGVYRDERAGLAHARLSIVDVVTGQQPLANERGTIWVTFNGEIFNYIELRAELVSLGHQFRTRSDTEVIVHAYEQWGAEAFRRFNGQWAVGVWDREHDTLVLARDPFGVNPLFIAEADGRLWFASEVKAIFAAAPELSRAFDPHGLAQVFSFWTPVAPRSVFAGVEELEPGAVRVYSATGMRQQTSWESRFPESSQDGFAGSLDDAVAAVRDALTEATSLRMLRADVPVGSYLSGGLDSSLVAALALRAKGSNFATFSLRFEDQEYDEAPFQHEMVARLGSSHHELMVSRDDIARAFPDVILHAERPILRTAPAPLFLLSRLVRQCGTKVVLTGEGADEMFAGYDLFREAKVRRFWARQPNSTWRPRLLERLYPYMARSPVTQRAVARQFFGRDLDQAAAPGFGHAPRWTSTSALKRLLAPAFAERTTGVDTRGELVATLPPAFARWSPLAQDQYLEVHTLLTGYLMSAQGDRMLMSHSVEGRFPFLDRHVVNLAESLPARYKLRILDEKHVLKRAAAEFVPAAIRERPKQPYRAPDALSFATPAASEWLDEVAGEAAVKAAGVFQPAAVAQLLDKCRARAASGQFSNTDNMAVVGVLSTQLVHHHFVARRPAAAAPATIRTRIDQLGTTAAPTP